MRETVENLLVKEADENVRLASLSALGRHGGPNVVPLMRKVAEDPASPARLRAAAKNWIAKLEVR